MPKTERQIICGKKIDQLKIVRQKNGNEKHSTCFGVGMKGDVLNGHSIWRKLKVLALISWALHLSIL